MNLIGKVLDMDNLTQAWQRVADNRGAPGVDGISIGRFARNWEANLRRIRDQVQAHQYQPARLRRTAVPKARGGGQRLLSIPVVADRVLQRAVLNSVDGLFERQFLDCSYGYRVGRGLRQAVAAMLQHRDRNLTWVLDADVDECFDSLDHELLDRFLAETIDDEAVMGLMRAWLRVGQRYSNPARGIALGMPVSPLCCNVALRQRSSSFWSESWAALSICKT